MSGGARRWRAALAVAALAAACSPLSYTVNNRLFRDLSADRQMRLFDAENDISMALDDRTLMHEVESRLDRARRVASGQQRRGVAGAPPGGQAAARALAAARVRYLAAAQKFVAARIDAQGDVVVAASAKFELAKAILLRKNNLPGATSIQVKRFEAQAEATAKAAKRRVDAVAPLRRAAARERLAWQAARQAAASASLVGDGLPLDDEDASWQAW